MKKKDKKIIIISSLTTFFIYCLSVFILSKWQDTSFNGVILFRPEIRALSGNFIILYVLIILSGWLLIYFVPGIIWILAFSKVSFDKNKISLFFQSFLASILLLIVSVSLFKVITGQSLNRLNFLGIILLLISIGFYLYCRLNRTTKELKNLIKFKKSAFLKVAIGVVFILLSIFIFREKIFVENFSEGGIEVFYPAISLKSHIAPFADLEMGEGFGLPVSDPYWTISFLNLFNLLLFGEGEGAIRLHLFIYLLMLYVLLNVFVNYANYHKQRSTTLYLIPFFFLYLLIAFFYVGHNAYFEDIAANLAATLFTFLLYLGVFFLLNRNSMFFLIASLSAILTLWSGLVLCPIILFAYWIYFNKERVFLRKTVLQYAIMLFILGSSYILYGWTNGYLKVWYQSIKLEYLDELLFLPNNYKYISVFLKYFIIFSGGLPILTLFFLKSKDKMVNFFSLVTLLYLLIVFKSGYINLHYFTPIIFLPLMAFLRLSSDLKKGSYLITRGLFLSILCVFIIFSWPKRYFVHTIYRELGKKTCMIFPSFAQAYRHRNITDLNFKDDMYFPHYIDIETIPYYADIVPAPLDGYQYYITDNKNPPFTGLKLLAHGKGIYLFGRDFNKHIVFNEKSKLYPSREEQSSSIFGELFRANFNYDNKERDYFYY